MQHCAGFISAGSLYMFRAQAPIIRSFKTSTEATGTCAQCCIKLVFHLTYTMMHGSTKLKLSCHVLRKISFRI